MKCCVRRALCYSAVMLVMGTSGCAWKKDAPAGAAQREAYSALRTGILDAIGDPEREAKAVSLVDDFESELHLLYGKKQDARAQLVLLNASFDTTRAEFDTLLRLSNDDIRLSHRRVLELRTAFIAITTPAEWTQILETRDEYIDQALESIQTL
jgi:hypothetical protein